MCGIIGIVGHQAVSSRLISALKRLEYRGYDSAGIAVNNDSGKIERRRATGKLLQLSELVRKSPIEGQSGIGHTRWATHGKANQENAHPHMNETVAIVHNGIIENFKDLRQELTDQGVKFTSETDTEVIVHLFGTYFSKTNNPQQAMKETLNRLHGAFAIAIIIQDHEDLMLVARKGSPLVIGLGEGENYIGSDAIALSELSSRIIYLEEGDWAQITKDSVSVFDESHTPVERPITNAQTTGALVDKGNYNHFMLKEIHEQPTVIAQTIGQYADPLNGVIDLPEIDFDLNDISRITLIACGTSYYAAMVAKYWFEQIAKIAVDVDIASEFRYRKPVMAEKGLTILVSQSGETADTLAALRYAKKQGQKIGTIVNVDGSSMAREADIVLKTHAGPEIGVASTKAFTCQLSVLACLCVNMAHQKGFISAEGVANYIQKLEEIPALISYTLNHAEHMMNISRDIAKARDVLFLGRGTDYPIAMEGALKLKEISYIHAEGYAAGEMKHGPIALIDEDVPIIVLAPSGALFEKTVSNMQEVMARGGKVILISDKDGIKQQADGTFATITIPKVDPFISPIIYAVPMQLLAYYTAVAKGTDVDQPRNLAKSVTVE